MNESVLLTVKKYIGGAVDNYNVFDSTLIDLINTALTVAYQFGVGSQPAAITDETSTWADVIGSDEELNPVKTYICQSVKMRFDPPESSSLQQAMKEDNNELAWRLSVLADELEAKENV